MPPCRASLCTTPLVLLVDEFGCRTTFQLIAGVNLLLIVVLYTVARDTPEGEGEKSSGPEAKEKSEGAISRVLLLLKQRDYWIISSGTFVSYGVFAAFQSLWAGPYLLEVMGFSAIAAGNTILLMNMGVIAGAPVWGALSDRLLKTRKWLVVAGHVVLGGIVLAIGLLSRKAGFGFLAFLFFLFGFFRMTGALMYAQIKELMPLHMAGTAMTGINFFTMTGPAVFLQGLGALMQTLYPNASRSAAAFQVSFGEAEAPIIIPKTGSAKMGLLEGRRMRALNNQQLLQVTTRSTRKAPWPSEMQTIFCSP
ncbi:MAG: MFS transporter [Deltaproteobacteria bacterium]